MHIRRRKAVALLAYLAVTGQVHSRDALATLLWPESDQSAGRAGLRRALASLKDALGEEELEADRETIGLRSAESAAPRLWVDVRAFRDLLKSCRAHGHPADESCRACLPLLAEAAALYTDDFMAGFTLPDAAGFDEWQFFQGQGLRDALGAVLDLLTKAYGELGDDAQAIGCARRWVSLDPLHEPAQRSLMWSYARAGQRSAALRQYELCRQALMTELGVDVSDETRRLVEAMQAERGTRTPEAFPVSRARVDAAVPRDNLPASLTPFVGRRAELAAIADCLSVQDCRLLTLVGPGGIGKTCLALEAARAQVDAYADGVYLVPMAPLQSSEAIVPAVARALSFSFRRGGDPERQLLDHLRGRQVLLVLDNLEHLLPDLGSGRRNVADVVALLLSAAPGLKVLATSRSKLNVFGEQVFVVGGMDYPALSAPAPGPLLSRDGGSAVELFLTCARRARPDLALTEQSLADVIEICRLVEGMPLAIVLSAAWMGVLSPGEVAAEIRRSLDILQTNMRGVPAEGTAGGDRHRSIRVVFDQSWDLLPEREREVFAGLSVFRGSIGRDAAHQVAGASLSDLMALIDRSLLQRVSEGRFQVHELLRRYGEGKLDASPDGGRTVRGRHSAYYAAMAQRWDVECDDPRWLAAVAEWNVEVENVRAAWDWAVAQGDVPRMGQAIGGLCRCYNQWHRRNREGETACCAAAERLSAMAGTSALAALVLAQARAWQSLFTLKRGEAERARNLLRQSVTAFQGAGGDLELQTVGSCALLPAAVALERARRTGGRAAFLLGDIDDFRVVNSTYGHATGDRMLAHLVRLWWEQAAGTGLAHRWGGEELVLLLPGAAEGQAVAVAEQVRQRVQEHVFQSLDGRTFHVTISIGVAVYPSHGNDVIALLARADQAAYRAKELGKNRVCVWGEDREPLLG